MYINIVLQNFIKQLTHSHKYTGNIVCCQWKPVNKHVSQLFSSHQHIHTISQIQMYLSDTFSVLVQILRQIDSFPLCISVYISQLGRECWRWFVSSKKSNEITKKKKKVEEEKKCNSGNKITTVSTVFFFNFLF